MKKQPRLIAFLLRSFLSRKVLVFCLCLFIAALAWLVTAFNRSGVSSLRVPVRFTNLPKDKVMMSDLPKELQLDVKATGFKLLFLSLRKGMGEMVVDFTTLKKLRENVYAFSPSSAFYMTRFLNTGVEIIRVRPDSLYFTFNNAYYKTVPVFADVMIDFEPAYNHASAVKTTPSTVILSGDSNIIRNIDTVFTERLVLNNLDKSVKQKARIIFPEEYESRVFSAVNEVQVEVNVDKFTDTEIEVPLEVLNLPPGLKIKTFPEKVKVKFQVGMADFGNTRPKDFRAVIDFKNADPKKNYMKIELLKSPSAIKNVRLFPEKAEFIIKK